MDDSKTKTKFSNSILIYISLIFILTEIENTLNLKDARWSLSSLPLGFHFIPIIEILWINAKLPTDEDFQ